MKLSVCILEDVSRWWLYTTRSDEMEKRVAAILIPQFLYPSKNSRINLSQRLELIEYDCEMTIQRFFHNDLEQIAKLIDSAINMNTQLLFQRLLKLLAQRLFTVVGNKKIGIFAILQGRFH